MELLFVVLLALVALTYFGYPLALALCGCRARRPTPALPTDDLPNVTLLIVAHNEAAVLRAKLENSLALDYRRDRLEIVVASDASTDATDDIARSFAADGVRLERRPTRGSQTGAQNWAAPRTSGDILVFSDANSMYDRDAIRHLVAPFADARVGCVVGRLRHSNAARSSVSFGEELYWRYESLLKRAQSRAGVLLFANGAIYAVRRALYRPVEGDWDHDTLVPLRTVLAHNRVAYAPRALAYEEAGIAFGCELRRKVRIILRDAWTFCELRHALRAAPLWVAVHILAHKVMRWLAWMPLAGMLLVAAAGAPRHASLRIALALQLAFYATALIARLCEPRVHLPGWARVPLYFALVNTAGCIATLRWLQGERQTFWTPRAGG